MKNDIFSRRPFNLKHKEAFTTLYSLSTLAQNAPNIMVRANTQNLIVDTSLPEYSRYDDIDTFVITTSADPENTIIYTSPTNRVDLSVRDGGHF